MTWRACYESGEIVASPDYAGIDRSQPFDFEEYATGDDLVPVVHLHVPAGRRLVRRVRHRRGTGGLELPDVVVIALESEDRSEVDAYFLEAHGDRTKLTRGSYTGEHYPPALLDFETVVAA